MTRRLVFIMDTGLGILRLFASLQMRFNWIGLVAGMLTLKLISLCIKDMSPNTQLDNEHI